MEKQYMKNTSISFKISIISFLVLFICLCLGGIVLMRYEKNLMTGVIDENLNYITRSIDEREQDEKAALHHNIQIYTRTLSHTCAAYLWQFVMDGLRETLRSYMSYPEIVAIRVLDDDREPVMAAWKKDDILFDKTLPPDLKLDEALSHQEISLLNSEQVGMFQVYYTDAFLNEKNRAMRENALSRTYASHSILLTRLQKAMFIQMLVILVIIVALVASLFFFLRKVVFKPLNRISDITCRLAAYDLTINVDAGETDEIGRLLDAVRNMVESLKNIIARASETSVQVNASTREISGEVSRQSAIAAQQSAAITEISSTMEALSGVSEEIADHSGSVVEMAETTFRRSSEGAASVADVMEKTRAISDDNHQNIREIMVLREKAGEITRVMDIINIIADQTRIIAFNAALEASSAGEAGKRFGVVAAEIRRLADNVTTSTGEIEGKISEIQDAANRMVIASEKSTKGIHEGLELFSRTADLLGEIVSRAQATTDAANRISLSTRQQKIATEQVVITLRDIVRGSEQTSEAIQRISAVSKNVAILSEDQQNLMKQFILEPPGKPAKKAGTDDMFFPEPDMSGDSPDILHISPKEGRKTWNRSGY